MNLAGHIALLKVKLNDMDTQKEKVYLLSESQIEQYVQDRIEKLEHPNAPSPELPLPIEIPSDEDIEKIAALKVTSHFVDYPTKLEMKKRVFVVACEWMRDKILSNIKK